MPRIGKWLDSGAGPGGPGVQFFTFMIQHSAFKIIKEGKQENATVSLKHTFLKNVLHKFR
jgi:hypothetical protein